MLSNEIIKGLINDVIESKYHDVSDNIDLYFKGDKFEYEEAEYSSKIDDIMQKLYKVLPNEYSSLLDELENTTSLMMCITEKRLFKQGVISGLTDLKYLEKIEGMIHVI